MKNEFSNPQTLIIYHLIQGITGILYNVSLILCLGLSSWIIKILGIYFSIFYLFHSNDLFECDIYLGIDPNTLSSSNTGTFIGNCFDETPSAQAEDYSKVVGYKQQFCGKVAQIFNLMGPSMVVDTACASSFCALHEAMSALRSNRCDRALVVGINMSLRATTQLQVKCISFLSILLIVLLFCAILCQNSSIS